MVTQYIVLTSPSDRQHARFRVSLSVRYETARDFVIEYAENLSKNGMFLRGAHHLRPMERVSVELDLPGQGTFQLVVEVVHVIDEAVAQAMGREPGAGCQVLEAPAGFETAMTAYLIRLGQRADHLAVVVGDDRGRKLSGAGYQVVPIAEPGEVAEALAAAVAPVIGIVVPGDLTEPFRSAAVGAGRSDIAVVPASGDGIDSVLETLDLRLQ